MEPVHKDINSPRFRPTSRTLPIALLRARERVMGPVRAMLADAGVTEQQWRVLRVLEDNGPCDATEVANASCLLMPSLTRILQVLENKEFCSRSVHPLDKRRSVIEITALGRNLLDQNAPASNKIFADLEAEFGTQNIDKLLSLLTLLVESESDATV